MIQEVGQNHTPLQTPTRWNSQREARLRGILLTLKRTATQYRRLTGRPLGVVTAEVAQYIAAEARGLTLVINRNGGYDALRGKERIQIMARAYPSGSRMPCPKLDESFDSLMLVILDDKTMNAREI
jgi:hypothetical protein